ncbi:sigma-70 family RNA polymerase sigma factor [Bradyrhizobium sp. SSUT18]|uniref:RNA polymerase sigma factor n=1 Tax=Bradyrhizobium sp. SSUT18 TaxID=3040602 RepID=UPI0024478128|nr:sigma-70 family RNA polymerase sigma factor [Bradyrhizobium sp. SSUT18]MDH2399213.1 sigma-70 family RNA polymerase sigma factor [Bradyrhizobium sp. SSUT18]
MSSDRREEVLSQGLKRLAAQPADETAWRSVYDRLWPFVTAIAWRRLRDRTAAEDAAQEVFLRLLKMKPFVEINEPEEFKAYVWRMTVNVANDIARKNQHSDRIQEAVSKFGRADEWVQLNPADQRLLFEEVMGLAQEDLSKDENEILKRLVVGLTIREIAGELGLAYSATAVRVHRIRRKLDKLLKS